VQAAGLQNLTDKKTTHAVGCPVRRLLGCDIYSFDFKINHISRHIQLPEPPALGPGARALPPGQQLPPLLVLNIQLPTYSVCCPRTLSLHAC
jgi:hypothetical protein